MCCSNLSYRKKLIITVLESLFLNQVMWWNCLPTTNRVSTAGQFRLRKQRSYPRSPFPAAFPTCLPGLPSPSKDKHQHPAPLLPEEPAGSRWSLKRGISHLEWKNWKGDKSNAFQTQNCRKIPSWNVLPWKA